MRHMLWVVASIGLSLSTGAHAQTIKSLTNINTNPFAGTIDEACTLHLGAHDRFGSRAACVAAFTESDDPASCPIEFPLQEDTLWWMTFTIDGVHHIGLYRIAFGTDVSEDDPRRAGTVCVLVPSDVTVTKPSACGNYAIEAEAPPPPKREVQRTKPQQQTLRQLPVKTSPVNRSEIIIGAPDYHFRSWCLPR